MKLPQNCLFGLKGPLLILDDMPRLAKMNVRNWYMVMENQIEVRENESSWAVATMILYTLPRIILLTYNNITTQWLNYINNHCFIDLQISECTVYLHWTC